MSDLYELLHDTLGEQQLHALGLNKDGTSRYSFPEEELVDVGMDILSRMDEDDDSDDDDDDDDDDGDDDDSDDTPESFKKNQKKGRDADGDGKTGEKKPFEAKEDDELWDVISEAKGYSEDERLYAYLTLASGIALDAGNETLGRQLTKLKMKYKSARTGGLKLAKKIEQNKSLGEDLEEANPVHDNRGRFAGDRDIKGKDDGSWSFTFSRPGTKIKRAARRKKVVKNQHGEKVGGGIEWESIKGKGLPCGRRARMARKDVRCHDGAVIESREIAFLAEEVNGVPMLATEYEDMVAGVIEYEGGFTYHVVQEDEQLAAGSADTVEEALTQAYKAMGFEQLSDEERGINEALKQFGYTIADLEAGDIPRLELMDIISEMSREVTHKREKSLGKIIQDYASPFAMAEDVEDKPTFKKERSSFSERLRDLLP